MKHILNIENEISIIIFYKNWQVSIIYINVIFMKLTELNTIILNIKFINI
jgi:hypothetical protein